MVERCDQFEVRRQQHPVAKHVTRHIADPDSGERVRLDVFAHDPGMTPHALPRTARRDAHYFVVVAVAAAGCERITEPEAIVVGQSVGDIAKRRRALVCGDDEVGVIVVVNDTAWRVYDTRRTSVSGDEVVGDVK